MLAPSIYSDMIVDDSRSPYDNIISSVRDGRIADQ